MIIAANHHAKWLHAAAHYRGTAAAAQQKATLLLAWHKPERAARDHEFLTPRVDRLIPCVSSCLVCLHQIA
eukprot:1139107-Pelagomonas_calceolata.AAC.2